MLGYQLVPNAHGHGLFRDGAAASLILLERLIREIAVGKFRPDSKISGRVVDSPIEPSAAQSLEVKIETVLSSEEEVAEKLDMSDSSGSTSSSESASSEILEGHSLNQVFAPPQPPEGFSKWLAFVHVVKQLSFSGWFGILGRALFLCFWDPFWAQKGRAFEGSIQRAKLPQNRVLDACKRKRAC